MALAYNEMTNKGVAQLVKICNRHRGQLTEPYPCCYPKGYQE